MIVCGIDPGLSGALAFLDHHGVILAIDDIPTMANPDAGPKTTIKREVDVCALRDLIRERIPADESALCALEHVSVMGGKGSQAIVSLAATKAAVASVLRLAGYEVKRVPPALWQRFFGIRAHGPNEVGEPGERLRNTKHQSLRMARELYPHAPLKLAKHHNRAEALLIARWAQRNLT
jgi:hypothetical protein